MVKIGHQARNLLLNINRVASKWESFWLMGANIDPRSTVRSPTEWYWYSLCSVPGFQIGFLGWEENICRISTAETVPRMQTWGDKKVSSSLIHSSWIRVEMWDVICFYNWWFSGWIEVLNWCRNLSSRNWDLMVEATLLEVPGDQESSKPDSWASLILPQVWGM